jgi:hypothetical protein
MFLLVLGNVIPCIDIEPVFKNLPLLRESYDYGCSNVSYLDRFVLFPEM